MFLVSDENQSHYLQTNIDMFGGDPDDPVSWQPATDAYVYMTVADNYVTHRTPTTSHVISLKLASLCLVFGYVAMVGL